MAQSPSGAEQNVCWHHNHKYSRGSTVRIGSAYFTCTKQEDGMGWEVSLGENGALCLYANQLYGLGSIVKMGDDVARRCSVKAIWVELR